MISGIICEQVLHFILSKMVITEFPLHRCTVLENALKRLLCKRTKELVKLLDEDKIDFEPKRKLNRFPG